MFAALQRVKEVPGKGREGKKKTKKKKGLMKEDILSQLSSLVASV